MEYIERIECIKLGPLKNNVYLVGNQQEVIVIDAADDAEMIAGYIGGRALKAILTTHGHFDHIGAAVDLRRKFEAPIYLHSEDEFLWRQQYPHEHPDTHLADGEAITVGEITLKAIHTPGHTPGSTCYYAPTLQTLFTGDTLFPGGPGATRWEYSDFKQIIDSISRRIFSLPGHTHLLPGHGEATCIQDEVPQLQQWMRSR